MSDIPLEEPAPSSIELKLELPATLESLLTCLGTIGDFAAAARLAPDLVARARIVLEELYSNTIKYGYGGECDRRVGVRLRGHGALTLVYEDDAPPFDPTGWNDPAAGLSAAESLREGEAGLALMFGLATRVAYEPRPNGNRLVVVFAAP